MLVATHDASLPAHRRVDFVLQQHKRLSARIGLRLPSRIVALCAAAALALAAWAALDPDRGGIAVLLAAFAVVAAGFAWLRAARWPRAT